MAAQRLKTEEWELVKENYHYIPPALRRCFEEVAVAHSQDDFEKFESAFYFALAAVHDATEELTEALWKFRDKVVVKSKLHRVRFAELVRSHVKSTQTDELVKSILKTDVVVSEEVPPLSTENTCGDAPSEIPRGDGSEHEEEDEYHFGRVLIPETPSTVPQEMCEGKVEDQFHFGGDYEFHFGSEPPSGAVSSVPEEVLEPEGVVPEVSVRPRTRTPELVKVQTQQMDAEALRGNAGAAEVSSTTPVKKVKIFVAEDGGSGALNVISNRVFHDRRMRLPSNNSKHKLPETTMWWMEKRERGLLEVLGDRSFRQTWIKWEADYTVLHFGQWDILRNGLGALKPMDFVEDVIFHIKLFREKSKDFIDSAQWRSYESRMKSHLFVLVAPKRDEVRQGFMPSDRFNNIRTEVIKALKYSTKRLHREAGVVICTAGSSYQLKIHAYLARLVCKECRPTLTELLARTDIRWGGCDAHLNAKWGKI